MRSLTSLLLPVVVILAFPACEKQPYAETRPFTHHGEHASADKAKGGEQAETSKEKAGH